MQSTKSRLRGAAIGLLVFLGIGAVAGGLALMIGPEGQIIALPISMLAGSPFENYFIPGAILFAGLGLGSFLIAVLAWRRHPLAPILTAGVGIALLIWLGVQIAIIGFSNDPPLQAIYLVVGVVIGLVGLGWMRREASPA